MSANVPFFQIACLPFQKSFASGGKNYSGKNVKRNCIFKNPCYNEGTLLHIVEQQTIHGGIIMAYVINDNCVSCGSCAEQCPAEAIEEG